LVRFLKPLAESGESRLHLFLSALLAACIARLWLMPLLSGFWLDEIVTAFIIRHGVSHSSFAVAPQVAATIYYALPTLSVSLLGTSEIAHRLPSVMAMGIALVLIGRLAARLIHPRAGWFAVFASLGLGGINYEAANARPYALGIGVAAASFFFLIRWLDSARWRDALLLLLSAGLLWRVHLIYWPLYLVFALYTALRLARSETSVSRVQAAAWFAGLAVVLLPVLFDALVILRQAGEHAFAPIPGLRELGNALKFGLIGTCVAIAGLFRAVRRTSVADGPSDRGRRSWSSLTLIGAWWLLSPFCLFLYSRFSGNSVFLDRYRSVALPGTVLAATVLAAWLMPPARWKQAALVLGVGVLVLMGQWQALWPSHDLSDWRGAARQARSLNLPPDTPVVCPSPFLEAKPPAWSPTYPLPGYFYAHLDIYPIPGRPVLFPYASEPGILVHAAESAGDSLRATGRFAIYGREIDVRFLRDWFAAQPELAGWRHASFGPFGNVGVALFENPSMPVP
jgi:hypothetical protein